MLDIAVVVYMCTRRNARKNESRVEEQDGMAWLVDGLSCGGGMGVAWHNPAKLFSPREIS